MRSTSSFLTYYQALTNVIVNAGRGFYKAILKQYDTNVRCYKSFQKKYLARLPNIIAALLFYTFILSGCENNKPAILFHAGAGQRSSLDEIAVIFAERNPDIKIDFSYKGSGYFIADITASKMGDLYMPGEEYYLLQA
ncbi:MAG: hypothetical protein JW841_00500, partial [Deltaproteobacteria bacterium]|nr:hypothetical protein [Deltaproteobacteria bacterium]